MLSITLVCVGRMREKHYLAAYAEYEKRLKPYCKFTLAELPEVKLPQTPSPAEIAAGLKKEAAEIEKQLLPGVYIIALCIEGRQLGSAAFAELLQGCASTGRSRVVFVIGSSFGLDESIKKRADLRLSMSEMTFPHHLARVMLAEQLYRGIMIIEGGKYHK